MRHPVRAILLVLAAASSALGAVPDCVSVRTSAPYRGAGYDHVVYINNGCANAVACRVRTDVNPEPIDVQVPPKTAVEVLTFRGSPAYAFNATVDCTGK